MVAGCAALAVRPQPEVRLKEADENTSTSGSVDGLHRNHVSFEGCTRHGCSMDHHEGTKFPDVTATLRSPHRLCHGGLPPEDRHSLGSGKGIWLKSFCNEATNPLFLK